MKDMSVTPEVFHAPMSSLKDAAAAVGDQYHQSGQIHTFDAQNKWVMSVTPPVAHVEMWPYVASAAVGSETHAATAVLIVVSSMTLLRRRTGLGSAQAALKKAITIHVLFILFGAAT